MVADWMTMVSNIFTGNVFGYYRNEEVPTWFPKDGDRSWKQAQLPQNYTGSTHVGREVKLDAQVRWG